MTDKMRFEGLTLTVTSLDRALEFYRDKLGLTVEWNAAPAFAMIRLGAGTLGLLALTEAEKAEMTSAAVTQKRGIHVEFSTDDLESLYQHHGGALGRSPPITFHDVSARRRPEVPDPCVTCAAS